MLYATSSFGIYIRSKCVQVWNNTSNCILFFPFPISYCDFSWFRLIIQLLDCGSEGSKYLQSLKFLILLRSATCCVPWIKNLWTPCDSFLTQQVMWVPDQNRLQQISGTFFVSNLFRLNLSKHTCPSVGLKELCYFTLGTGKYESVLSDDKSRHCSSFVPIVLSGLPWDEERI